MDGYREDFWASRGGGGLDNIILVFCQISLYFLSNLLYNKSTVKTYLRRKVKLVTGVVLKEYLISILKILKNDFNRENT